MKTSKKILGVVLALVMLVNVFAMFSFAAAPDSAIDLTITPDKASYSAGDIVTFTVSEKVESVVGEMRIGGNYAIGFNSNVIEMLKPESQDLADYSFTALQAGYDAQISTVLLHEDNIAGGDTLDSGHDWNKVTVLSVGDDLLTGFDATAGVDLFTFQMKISDTAADGDYVVGFNIGSYINLNGCVNDQTWGGVYGYDEESAGMDYGYGTTVNYGFTNATIHIGSAAAAPVLSAAGRQVKMDVVNNAVVEHTEQLRVVSSISNDDWNTYFANTTDEAATTNKLVEVGIVATQGAFNMGDAQDAAKLGKGAHGDYTVATTTYIQNTGSDYRFGARIEYQTNVFDTTYVAFAKYLNAEGAEAYVFYDASYALAFATDYSTITADYIAFLNQAA